MPTALPDIVEPSLLKRNALGLLADDQRRRAVEKDERLVRLKMAFQLHAVLLGEHVRMGQNGHAPLPERHHAAVTHRVKPVDLQDLFLSIHDGRSIPFPKDARGRIMPTGTTSPARRVNRLLRPFALHPA